MYIMSLRDAICCILVLALKMSGTLRTAARSSIQSVSDVQYKKRHAVLKWGTSRTVLCNRNRVHLFLLWLLQSTFSKQLSSQLLRIREFCVDIFVSFFLFSFCSVGDETLTANAVLHAEYTILIYKNELKEKTYVKQEMIVSKGKV